MYHNADIVLLDDPLSALDQHVKRCIMDNVIEGYLGDKTRILVTHVMDVLDKADRIIIMENGEIKHMGTYS